MRPFLLSIVSMCAIFGGLSAEAAAEKVSVSIDVKPLDSGGATKSKGSGNLGTENDVTHKTTDNYASTRVHQTGLTLQIETHNYSTAPAHVHVEWVFYAEPFNGKGEMKPHKKGGQDFDLPASGHLGITAESGPITSKTEKHLKITTGALSGNVQESGSTDKSGEKLKGWYVRLKSGGAIVQVKASGTTFEKLGQTDK